MTNYICEDSGASFNRKDMWNDVNDRLPNHEETVLAYNNNKNQFVCIFLDKIKMKEFLNSEGVEPKFPANEKPYLFSSQENIGNYLLNVTHWMYLPKPPEGEF